MMLKNFFKKGANKVNCQEAYNIWDLLAAKYLFIEKLHIWRNFAHDKDLQLLLKKFADDLSNIIKTLEKQAEKHSIPGPEVGVKEINTSANTEILRDELIAQDVLLWLQGITEGVLRSIKTATTNDELRKIFQKINKVNLGNLNKTIPYLKLKGWINVPLRYQKIPERVNEDLDSAEAYHLWDHLTFRYDNIRQTETVKDLVNDVDLKSLIIMGLNDVLKKQAGMLETVLLKFGVPLPKKPVKVIAWPSKASNFIKDDYIYRVIYDGITGTTSLHNHAIKQSITNDNIRKIFTDLLLSEIDILDKFIIYGKMKGYLNEPPQFNINKSFSFV